MKLTPNQTEAMLYLSNYVGRDVDVFTSQYIHNVNPVFTRRAIGYFNSATLRGLEAKGLIRINAAFWKGANITVLRDAN